MYVGHLLHAHNYLYYHRITSVSIDYYIIHFYLTLLINSPHYCQPLSAHTVFIWGFALCNRHLTCIYWCYAMLCYAMYLCCMYLLIYSMVHYLCLSQLLVRTIYLLVHNVSLVCSLLYKIYVICIATLMLLCHQLQLCIVCYLHVLFNSTTIFVAQSLPSMLLVFKEVQKFTSHMFMCCVSAICGCFTCINTES